MREGNSRSVWPRTQPLQLRRLPTSTACARPTPDGDAGGDAGGDADEAQVDAPNPAPAPVLGLLLLLLPPPPVCLSQSSPVDAVVGRCPSPRLEPRGAIIRGNRTPHWPPEHPLPLIRDSTFPSPRPSRSTIGQVDNGTGMDGCTHATRSKSPDLRRGCASTRNLTEITTNPQSTQQVDSAAQQLTWPVTLERYGWTPPPDGMLAAGCFTMFWSTCWLCSRPPPDRFCFARPPASVRTHLRQKHLDRGYSEGPGPA